MIVTKATAYSASATDVHKPRSEKPVEKSPEQPKAAERGLNGYTFDEFYNIVHGQKKAEPTSTQNPLHGRLISDKTVGERTSSAL